MLPLCAVQTNSFQAVVATDGCVTYTMFHYINNSISWSGRYNLHASVGYTDGRNVFKYSHPSSNSAEIKEIDSENGNTNVLGKWLWRTTPGCSGLFLYQRQCLQWSAADTTQYTDLSLRIRWTQPCPCSLAQVEADRRFRFLKRDSASRVCYSQLFPRFFKSGRLSSVSDGGF